MNDPTPTRGRLLPVALGAWALALVVGFAVVLALGGPIATAGDELAAAYRPAPPVSESVARATAETIVRLQHDEFLGLEPVVTRADDFGIDRFVIVYSRPELLSGVRIAVEVATGDVTVTTYP